MSNILETKLQDILSDKQIIHILNQAVERSYNVVGYELRPAADGLSGFLGDHFKLILRVQNEEMAKKLQLFVKTLPIVNKPKAEFIDNNNYFKREALMFKLIKEVKGAEGPNPWSAFAYIHTKNLVVMPDLCVQGYKLRPYSEYLDLSHIRCTVKSMAKFHAAIANYLTKSVDTNSVPGFEYCLVDPTFCDSPWLQAAAKLTVNFLKEFSITFSHCDKNLEKKLGSLYIKACESLKETDNTLNLLIHKDLWINNIMFKYTNNVPTNAILIDYQLTRFAPPAFDLMILLYLTTSQAFRKCHEIDVLNYYFLIFLRYLDEPTKQRLKEMSYNRESFRVACERARMFGLLEAITTFPYVIMDPHTAQKIFDDPETYLKYLEEDRSVPVLAYAHQHAYYRDMQLEVCEEFMQRYVNE